MKKIFLLAIVAISTVTRLCAQEQKFPEPFVVNDLDEDFYSFIQAPPSLTSGEFAYDFFHYQHGRELREIDGVSEQALFDEAAQLYEVFDNKVIGIELSRESTPEIILLCERVVSDASKANTTVKKKYQRIRPFATFHDPSLKPETDEEEAKTFSYPSGHSSRGYMFALALCTVMPEKTPEIMVRAQDYAYNRVICGHHWKSDTDASLLLATAMFANVVSTDEYQAQLKKARAEYQKIIDGAVGVSEAKLIEHPATTRAYTISGLPADDNSRGIIIQNGQKTMAK
ncbi:MAG: phosphatase PAP2 family protein [Bacteroidaceae bacterium]|nr:phosphatase PAP2 family protein [Bacteroidaceae bacterium]